MRLGLESKRRRYDQTGVYLGDIACLTFVTFSNFFRALRKPIKFKVYGVGEVSVCITIHIALQAYSIVVQQFQESRTSIKVVEVFAFFLLSIAYR